MGVEVYYKIKYDPKFCPCKGDSVKISSSDNDKFILANEETKESYVIDKSAALIWKLMDGRHSISSIQKQLGNEHSAEDVEGFITFAAQEGLIENVENDIGKENVAATSRRTTLKPKVISPLVINMPVLDASQSKTIFRKLYKLTRIFFTRIFLFIAIVVVGFTAFLLRDIFFSTLSSPSSFTMQGSTILGFLIFSIVLIFPILVVHELAHGLALTHFGGNPGELGTGLYYFYPMFYCDTSASWRLARWKRILVSIVGPLSTMFIGSVAGLLARFNVFPDATYLLEMTFFFSYYIALLNMAPFLETDGYFALMDILNIPNLRSEAFGYIKTYLTKGPRQANLRYEEYSRRQKVAMGMFGVLSVGWSVITIYLSYLFFGYIIKDALVQLTNLINSIVTITGMSSPNIEGLLISIGVAIGSLGLLTFISLRVYAMAYLPLKSVASKMQRYGGKPISIDRTYISAFFYVPVLFGSLRKKVLKKLGKCARRISQDSSVTEEGELITARMALSSNSEKTFSQIRSDAIRVESFLRFNYNAYVRKLLKVMRNERMVSEFYMIDENTSSKTASLLKRNDFVRAFNERMEKVYADIGQLLESFVCFVWSVDLRPEVFSQLDPKDFEYAFLEDVSTSTSIYEVGKYRREKILGSESIESMLKGMGEHFRLLKEDPQIMQTTHATVLFEPIKNRLMIFGRAKRVGELRKVAEHIFLIPTRSALETAALQGLSASLLRLSQFIERSPTFAEENIKTAEYKELRFLTHILDSFSRSLEIVEENIDTMQRVTDIVYAKTKEAQKEINTLDYSVALLDQIVGMSEDEFEQHSANRAFYRALSKQNQRLLGKLQNIRDVVTKTVREKEGGFSKALRRISLTIVTALVFSVLIALYLSTILKDLGTWNLLFLTPLIIISVAGLLSLIRTVRISKSSHSPIIDSLLLLSNHYSSLAGSVPLAGELLNRLASEG